jgi:hypothetical protein
LHLFFNEAFLWECHEMSCFSCSFLHNLLVRFPSYEMSCFLRGIIIICGFLLFGCYEISLWDVMFCEPYELFVDVIFRRGFFRLLFLRVGCECIRPSFLGGR